MRTYLSTHILSERKWRRQAPRVEAFKRCIAYTDEKTGRITMRSVFSAGMQPIARGHAYGKRLIMAGQQAERNMPDLLRRIEGGGEGGSHAGSRAGSRASSRAGSRRASLAGRAEPRMAYSLAGAELPRWPAAAPSAGPPSPPQMLPGAQRSPPQMLPGAPRSPPRELCSPPAVPIRPH
jgi:hypothetical protein